MSDLGTILFRSAVFLLVLGWIWWLVGPELTQDATSIGMVGSKTVQSDLSFADYPMWLQIFVVLLATFAIVVTGLVLWFIVHKIRTR